MSTSPQLPSADASSAQEPADARDQVRALQAEIAQKDQEIEAMQRTLRVTSSYLREVLSAVSDVLLVVDEDGIILTVNRSVLMLLEYSERELLGEALIEIAPDVSAKNLGELSRRGDDKLETWLRTHGDQRIPVLLAVSRLQDPEGDVVYVCAGTDMRQRLRLDAELRQAQKLESLGALAAGVAHDINNPLNYVISNLDYLIEETPPELANQSPDYMGALNQAYEGAIRVHDVVRELLAFSRASDDDIGPTDVHAVMDSTLRIAISQIKYRANLVRQYGDIPPVQGNQSLLGQVFLNLLINAAHALPEEEFERNELRITTDVDDAGRVTIEVRDTGSGISPDVVERIFEPFFTTKPVGEGTGLGLAISHNIITRLGGELTVDSEVGEGTAFTIALPVSRDE